MVGQPRKVLLLLLPCPPSLTVVCQRLGKWPGMERLPLLPPFLQLPLLLLLLQQLLVRLQR